MHNQTHYDWLLFDADETLFNFDAFQGLQVMFKQHHNILFTEKDFEQYQLMNKPLWLAYEQGKINVDQLKTQRFETWAKKLNIPAIQMNKNYVQTMATISTTLEGAKELMDFIQTQPIHVGIITNGFSDLQEARLKLTDMEKYIDLMVISEEVGKAKPDPMIFQYAYETIGQPNKDRILMIGDNINADILGGQNFGFDTCWLNRHKKSAINGIKPTYTIEHLSELKSIII